jgi:hypothetical protein
MFKFVIVILIYHRHKPIDSIKIYLKYDMKVWPEFIWLRAQRPMADCCRNTVMTFRLL